MSKGGGGGAMQGGRGQQQTSRGQQQGGFGQQRGGFAQEQVGYGNQGGNYQYRNPRSSYMGNRGAKGGFGMQAPPPRSGLRNYGQQSDYRGSMGGKGGQQQRGYNPPSAPNYGEIGRGAMGRGSKGGMSNMGGGLNNSSIPAPQGGIYRGGSKDFSDQNYRKVDPSSLYSDPTMGGGAKAEIQGATPPPPPENYYSGDERFTQDQGLSLSRADDIANKLMIEGGMPQLSQAEAQAQLNQANSEVQRLSGLRDQLRLDPFNVDIQKQMGFNIPKPERMFPARSERGLASLASQEPPMQGQPMAQDQPMSRQVQPTTRQQLQLLRSRGR